MLRLPAQVNWRAPSLLLTAALVTWAAPSCAHDELSTGTWVHSVRLEGVDRVSARDLKKGLATKQTGWWPFARKRWFDEAALDVDLRRVVAFYADHGFFDARVVKHQVRPHGAHSVDVVIQVEEGEPTHVTEVRLEGFPAGVESTARKEARRDGVEAERVFEYGPYAELKSRLTDQLRDKGYAYAEIGGGVDVNRDQRTAVVTLDAKPGPPVRFGTTTIKGNGNLPADRLLRRVIWKPGDVYDPKDIALTQMRLHELGVFSGVRVSLPPEPTPTADVTIEVSPGKLRELRVGGGVGAELLRQEVRGRVELVAGNFLGGLRKLTLRVRPAYVVLPSVTNVVRSGLAATNDVQLTQPDVFTTNISLHALLGYDIGIAEGYKNYGPRALLGLDRPFFRGRVRVGASWDFQYLRFFDVNTEIFNDATDQFYGFENPYRLAYLDEFFHVDLRDNPLDPTYGAYLAFESEQGSPLLGGAFSYVKALPDLRVYAPLGRRVVAAGRGLLGWLRPSGLGESPITRRFALGGPSSHRGFGFGRLSPQAVDPITGQRIPVGGDGAVLFSAELRIEVTKISGNWLGIVPFFDAGNVTPRFQDLNLGNLNLAVGMSAEYTTILGILRAGAGVRLNNLYGNVPDPGERVAYHLTIGEAF